MTGVESTILNALIELDQAVKSLRTAGSGQSLGPLLARLDELTDQLPDNASPDLVHYLRRKSYEKARLWLEGRDAENARGRCGH